MKYLHIAGNDKFLTSYIEFLEKNFDVSNHYFVFSGGVKKEIIPILNRDYIWKMRSFKKFLEVMKLFSLMLKSENICIHGLFNRRVVQFLFLNPWFLKKCNWVIWGGDLYSYQKPKIAYKNRWIDKSKLEELARPLMKTHYGKYLLELTMDN